MRLLFVVWLACILGCAAAQPVRWMPGTVVLHTREVLNGDVGFQTADIVLFRSGGHVQVFSPAMAESFRYFDAQDNLLHHLVCGADERSIIRFYEVVLAGPVQVVRLFRPRMPVERAVSHTEDFTYAVWFEDVRADLRLFRKKILPRLAAADPQLRTIIRGRGLRPHRPADAIRIAHLFNGRATAPNWLASQGR
jgi:hypothetical protein